MPEEFDVDQILRSLGYPTESRQEEIQEREATTTGRALTKKEILEIIDQLITQTDQWI